MKYGIIGGTFNPVHSGHLIAAESVRQEARLDKIIFILTANPPHKDAGSLIKAEHREMMLNEAIKDNYYFEFSDIEAANNSGKTYTADTLERLKKKFGNDIKLYLIIGMDNLLELHTWKEPEKIFSLADVIVTNRPGYNTETIQNEFKNKVKIVNIPNIEISSTGIRQRIKNNKSIKYLVPGAVEKYIRNNKLYA